VKVQASSPEIFQKRSQKTHGEATAPSAFGRNPSSSNVFTSVRFVLRIV
jgi:hypothetical protein